MRCCISGLEKIPLIVIPVPKKRERNLFLAERPGKQQIPRRPLRRARCNDSLNEFFNKLRVPFPFDRPIHSRWT